MTNLEYLAVALIGFSALGANVGMLLLHYRVLKLERRKS